MNLRLRLIAMLSMMASFSAAGGQEMPDEFGTPYDVIPSVELEALPAAVDEPGEGFPLAIPMAEGEFETSSGQDATQLLDAMDACAPDDEPRPPQLTLFAHPNCQGGSPWTLRSTDEPSRWTAVPWGRLELSVDLPEETIGPIDAVEITLDGSPLDLPIDVASPPPRTALNCPAPGRHLLQGRFLSAGRWSPLSAPLRFEIRKPRTPRIVALGEAEGPLQPNDGAEFRVRGESVRVRLADVPPQGVAHVFVDDHEATRLNLSSDCCVTVPLRLLASPGPLQLAVSVAPCADACAVTSERSRAVALRYENSNAYIRFERNCDVANDSEPCECTLLPVEPHQYSPEVVPTPATRIEVSAPAQLPPVGSAAGPAMPTWGAGGSRIPLGCAPVADCGADRTAEIAKELARIVDLLVAAEANVKDLETKQADGDRRAKAAKDAVSVGEQVLNARLDEVKARVDDYEKASDTAAKATAATALVNANTNMHRARVALANANATATAALADVAAIGKQLDEAKHHRDELKRTFEFLKGLLESTGSDASIKNNGAPIHPGSCLTFAPVPLSQTLLGLQGLQASFGPRDKNCGGTWVFEAPASFAFRGHGPQGDRYVRDELLIYEGMEFGYDPETGDYWVDMDYVLASVPATLNLQLELRDSEGDWHTLTVRPIQLPARGARERSGFLPPHLGWSKLLIGQQFTEIRRSGTARLGHGQAGLGAYSLTSAN